MKPDRRRLACKKLRPKISSVEMKIEIVEFEQHWARDFARLNYEWIEKYFSVEKHDREILDEPHRYVIEPGGQIFMAVADASQGHGYGQDIVASQNKIAVGAVAMIPSGEGIFELTKMAVSPEFQGRGISNLLMEACINFASQQRARKVFLESHRKLKPALALYTKYGFVEVPTDPNSEYARADIRMEREFVVS